MLCEENYAKLLRLMPNIEQKNVSNAIIHGQILATGPFTVTILLSQSSQITALSTPLFRCRVYLDTKSVEVISIEGEHSFADQHINSPRGVLNKKWAINYFLEKWLSFQLGLLNIKQPRQFTTKAELT